MKYSGPLYIPMVKKNTANRFAGTGKSNSYKGMSDAAIKKKRARDKAINQRPEQKKKRAELNKANRKAGTYGNGDKKDLAHTKKGLVAKPQSVNRGSKTDMPGDRRARGGKK